MVTPWPANYTSARNETPQGLNFTVYQIQPKVYLGKKRKNTAFFAHWPPDNYKDPGKKQCCVINKYF